ncbi:MAG: T9SS type A sorting domain-containing protein, partial [Bacteroidota bacterium]
VLPGDANNDQFANAWDLLPIGIAYGQTGPARPNASLSWTPQLAPDWGQSLPSGLDLKHADSDGNGVINADDTLAIGLNYNLLQSGSMATTGGGIPLYMDMPTALNPGDTLEIPVILGTMDTMVNNLYGLAFSLDYDSSQVKPNSVHVVFDSSWVGTDDQDLLTIFHDDFNSSVLEVGLVRNDGIEVSGYGQIARIIVVLDDDIAKKEIEFSLSWQAVDVIHQNQTAMTVSPRASDAAITISTANEELLDQSDIRAFPNPARQQLTVRREKPNQACQVRLLDLTGKVQLSETMNSGQSQIILPVHKLAKGVYLLQVQESDSRILNRKIVIDTN